MKPILSKLASLATYLDSRGYTEKAGGIDAILDRCAGDLEIKMAAVPLLPGAAAIIPEIMAPMIPFAGGAGSAGALAPFAGGTVVEMGAGAAAGVGAAGLATAAIGAMILGAGAWALHNEFNPASLQQSSADLIENIKSLDLGSDVTNIIRYLEKIQTYAEAMAAAEESINPVGGSDEAVKRWLFSYKGITDAWMGVSPKIQALETHLENNTFSPIFQWRLDNVRDHIGELSKKVSEMQAKLPRSTPVENVEGTPAGRESSGVVSDRARVSRKNPSVGFLQKAYNQSSGWQHDTVVEDGLYGPRTHAALQNWADVKDDQVNAALSGIASKQSYTEVTAQDLAAAAAALRKSSVPTQVAADGVRRAPDEPAKSKLLYDVTIDDKPYRLMLTHVLKHRAPGYLYLLDAAGLIDASAVSRGDKAALTRLRSVHDQIYNQIAEEHENVAGWLLDAYQAIASTAQSYASGPKLLDQLYAMVPNFRRVSDQERQDILADLVSSFPRQFADIVGKRVDVIDDTTPVVNQNQFAAHKSAIRNGLWMYLPKYMKG